MSVDAWTLCRASSGRHSQAQLTHTVFRNRLSLVGVWRDVVDAMVIVYGQAGEPWLAGVTIKHTGTYAAYMDNDSLSWLVSQHVD